MKYYDLSMERVLEVIGSSDLSLSNKLLIVAYIKQQNDETMKAIKTSLDLSTKITNLANQIRTLGGDDLPSIVLQFLNSLEEL